jgi:YHS domain-containing protein
MTTPSATTMIAIDPVCGMLLDPESAAASFVYAGWTYLFCCEECLETFRKAPNDCVLYLAHNQSGSLGFLCRHQRASARPLRTEAHR